MLILADREAIYFSAKGWTGIRGRRPTGKSLMENPRERLQAMQSPGAEGLSVKLRRMMLRRTGCTAELSSRFRCVQGDFEDQNFRVIAATWTKGTTDKPHGHPLPFVVYPLNDCTLRLHNPDARTRDSVSKAGTAFAGPPTASHTAENISEANCCVRRAGSTASRTPRP
jgi:hypothetical protein